jgi:Domain of Unknown Function (DUF928)
MSPFDDTRSKTIDAFQGKAFFSETRRGITMILNQALTRSLLALTIAFYGFYSFPAQAQSANFFERVRAIFSRPSSAPAAGRRRGAAIRSGTCQAMNPPLTALIPLYQTAGSSFLVSTTTAEYPTLWFYLPYAITPDRPAELRRETPDPTDQNYVQQRTVLRLTDAPVGVIGVRLPPTEAPLGVNQSYNWTFVVLCDRQDASTSQFVSGSIVRLAAQSTLIQQLRQTDPKQRSRLYTQAGFWEDSITTLADLKRRSPNDSQLAAEWINLLKTVDLEAIAAKPIVKCCDGAK